MIIKNSFIYLTSSVLSKSVPFLMLPILTKYLSPEEYGKLSIFLIFVSLYSTFVGISLHTNISKDYYRVKRGELAKIIGNILFILLITTSIYFLVSLVIYSQVEEVSSMPSWLLLIIPFIASLQMVNNLNTSILRNEQRAYMFGVFEVSLTVITMVVTIFCLVCLGFGWYSQIVGIVIAGIMFCIIGMVYMYKRDYITFKFDIIKVKSILHISIPLIPHVLGGLVIAASDRLFIEYMISLEAVGLYAVGYSFGMIVQLFTDAFIKAWSPWFYKALANPTDSRKKKIVKYTYIYIIGIFMLAIIVAVVSKFLLPYYVAEKYSGASKFIFWVSMGYALRGVYQILFPYLVHTNTTRFLAINAIVTIVVNTALNYVLIDNYGAIGAAYATALAFAVSAILLFFHVNRVYKMPWVMRRENVK